MTGQANLAAALAAFQSEAPSLPKDSTNPHFRSKFTSLDKIGETIGPLLAKHGLAWATLPCRDTTGAPALEYKLLHISGESLGGTMPLLLSKEDSQGLGSAITYARRYSICAVLNLVADEDDDGNRASRPPAPKRVTVPPPRAEEGVLEGIRAGIKGLGWKVGDVRLNLTAIGVQDVSDVKGAVDGLTPSQAEEMWGRIEAAVQEPKAAA